jgi:hypothetical protein
MFSKISRYRKLTDMVIIDAQGHRLASKSLRLLPDVTGTFLHTVEEVDRLDHLAFKYYSQPRNWWRICDANPEFMSPQALLGKEALVTARFPLIFSSAGQPPWSDLLKNLSQRLGVEDVQFTEDIQLVPQKQTVAGQDVMVTVERYGRAAVVTFNQMNVTAGELAAIITAVGFNETHPEPIGRVGKPIIIPPDVVG